MIVRMKVVGLEVLRAGGVLISAIPVKEQVDPWPQDPENPQGALKLQVTEKVAQRYAIGMEIVFEIKAPTKKQAEALDQRQLVLAGKPADLCTCPECCQLHGESSELAFNLFVSEIQPPE